MQKKMSISSAVTVRHLRKIYKFHGGLNFFSPSRSLTALDDLSFELPEGSVCALLGPNGAGKSTLLKILSGLVLPDSGEAMVYGQKPDSATAPSVSLILGQEKSFYWRLTGRQNLEFFAALYGLSSRETPARIKQLAEMLELEALDRAYQEMSTGHRQRLAIARALLSDARLVLMDEPARSLDPGAAAKFYRTIQERLFSPGRTIVFATHDFREAEHLASHVMVLSQGKLRYFGASLNAVSLEHLYKEHTEYVLS